MVLMHDIGQGAKVFSANIKFQRKKFMLDAEIELNAGCITALVGPSGSGKTSFMRLMAGLEKPESGFIRSVGRYLYHDENNICIVPQKRQVGLMFQDYALFDHLNIAENIAYGVEKSKRESVIEFWLKRINLSHRAKDFPQMLSGGEKQRVALARALACEPEVLLLDEPFSALDSILRHELRREIQLLIKDSDIPVLIATHDLVEARLIADQISVMVKGKIIRQGEMGEVFSHPGSVAAAKALGWQNILPVERTLGCVVSGAWGELELLEQPLDDVLAIGIPESQIRIEDDAVGIDAQIVHIVDLDDSQTIEVNLAGNVRLIFNQSLGPNPMKMNQSTKIIFNRDRVKPFYV